jgi:hypothetical protein
MMSQLQTFIGLPIGPKTYMHHNRWNKKAERLVETKQVRREQ